MAGGGTAGGSGRPTYLGDHLASSHGTLPMVGLLAFLLQHPLPRGTILQGKLANYLTELRNLQLPGRRGGHAQEEKELIKPVGWLGDCFKGRG